MPVSTVHKHPSTPDAATARARSQRARRVGTLFDQAAFAGESDRKRIEKSIVVEYLDVAEAVARRYSKQHQDWGDIRQVAYVGLVKAASRFDQTKGDDFVSFAVPTIAGEIKRYLRDNGWFIRPPRHIQELRSAIFAAVPRITQELGRDPEPDELAAGLGERVERITEALGCQDSLRPASLDATVYDGGALTLGDTIGAQDPGLERAELAATLNTACHRLSNRERRILYLRFVMEQTQSEIARELGVTQMQVSRLLTKILARLREELSPATLAA